MDREGCYACNRECKDLGAFAVEMLIVIDLQQAKGEALLVGLKGSVYI